MLHSVEDKTSIDAKVLKIDQLEDNSEIESVEVFEVEENSKKLFKNLDMVYVFNLYIVAQRVHLIDEDDMHGNSNVED